MSIKRVVIVTPAYSEKVGGAVVLHKLCDVLRKAGYQAYLYPYASAFMLRRHNWLQVSWLLLKQQLRIWLALQWGRFDRHSTFDTPLYDGSFALCSADTLTIYPETVQGNPLQAAHVVRWLLHQPGFHTGEMSFARGDLLIKFNSAIKDVVLDGVSVANRELKVIHYPLEHYYPPQTPVERSGTAVCIRKGAGKPFIHDEPAVIIDNLPHAEVAEILRRSRYFVSYDTYTAYSLFAVLCGCISIVVPDPAQTEEAWYPQIEDRWGIAYGFAQIPFAQATAELQVQRIKQQVEIVETNVKLAFEEILQYVANKALTEGAQ